MSGSGTLFIDPEWSPSALVTRRLRDVSIVHASRLAERTTIESLLLQSRGNDDEKEEKDDDDDDVVGDGGRTTAIYPIARMALPRSSCPQPPNDDGITGGGSSVSCDVHFSAMNIRLDPLERCAPHRIVVPDEGSVGFRGEIDGGTYDIEQRSAIWNAITALSTLCEEVQELDFTFNTRILPSIVLFGADDDNHIGPSSKMKSKSDILDERVHGKRESELLARIGRFLPALQLASNGTARVRRLIKNMLVQLGAVRTPAAAPFTNGDIEGGSHGSDNASAVSSPTGAHNSSKGDTTRPPVFGPGTPMIRLGKAISTALRLLVTVDVAVSSNADLQEAWPIYKDVVMEWSEQKRADSKLDSDFESFERMIIQLDMNLLSSRSFITSIEQNFDPRGRFQAAKFALWDEVKSIITTLYGQYCERVNTELETTERLDCVGIYAMYVLYRRLLPPNVVPDTRLHKNLWSVFPVMAPILELYGPLHFIPREFIMTYAPYKAVKGCFGDVAEIRSSAATMVLKWDGSFSTRVSKTRVAAVSWLAVADSELSPTVPIPHYRSIDEENDDDTDEGDIMKSVMGIEVATTCILRGMQIAHSASILLRTQLLTHRALGLKYDPNHIISIMSLMEVLKSIEKMLRVKRRAALLSFQRCTLKMLAQNILKKLDPVRSFVDKCSSSMDFSRSSDRARSITRVSACLTALEGVLQGTSSFSPIRRHSIAFSVAACMEPIILEVFSDKDFLAVDGYIKDLSQVASIEETLLQVCDCSFLYFYRDMFPQFVSSLYHKNLVTPMSHIQLVLSAFSDPERILVHINHLERNPLSGMSNCHSAYQNFVLRVLKEEFVEPLCQLIETDLRLVTSGAKGVNALLRKFIALSPLYICHMLLHVRKEVENFLERSFYDLSTLNLKDCNTYNKMRIIATERYGLHLTDPFLPDGCLDIDLDFMDIVKDLDRFISHYNYNMIDQSFVERRPESGSKFLHTIVVENICTAIRQHGLGIVSSIVDTCYKLLTMKFESFSIFLAYDDIKSLLSREYRWFENQRSEGTTMYPFGRALTFAQEIKKLVTGNVNALEQCRIAISEMGNIVSLVRMFRAAKRRVLSGELPFILSYSVSDTVKDLSDNNSTSAKTGIDDVISSILQKSDPDFVRALVSGLQGVTNKSESGIPNNFFCIVPALCLYWMDISCQGKEMMHKKNITRDGYFTDDGFAVGLAFVLSVFGQTKSYESLHWFKSIQSKYATDEDDLTEKKNSYEAIRNAKISASKQTSWFSSSSSIVEDNNKDDDEEMTILTLMGKRLDSNRREMAMLFFSMSGALSFFKDRVSTK